MQRNWIGRSEGAELAFPVTGHPGKRSASSPRGPTPCSASRSWCSRPSIRWSRADHDREQRAAVESVCRRKRAARARSSVCRRSRKRRGVFTGAYAHNLFTNKDIPIWIADYVLMGYGTGAIMAAPGEDQRDFEFATQIRTRNSARHRARRRQRRRPPDRAFTEHGIAINSGFLDGQDDGRCDARSAATPRRKESAARLSATGCATG